jgi:predicted DNA-binding transcriptional regulator AlpA
MKLIKSKEARILLGGYSSSQFERLQKTPDFPKPVKIYPEARLLMWIEDEIREYIAKRCADREQTSDRDTK